MSDLNKPQQKIARTHDGMVLVDAGPGTGKTHTIVERYISMITRPDVSPKDVLLLTFTNNAAAEMEERIKKRMSELGMEKESKLVMTKTFDAFCLSIVLDSPDLVSSFFGFPERLTRAATMYQNNSMNKDYFSRFLDGFLSDRGEDYGDIGVIASSYAEPIMDLIESLMSRGLIPQKEGWFGNGWDRILDGDIEGLSEGLKQLNQVSERGKCDAYNAIKDLYEDDGYRVPQRTPQGCLPEEALKESAEGRRSMLFRFVHDVYYAYVRQSVADNRLTFNIVALLAFTVLYGNRSVRERNSFRYLMVDEFQDTNDNQLMISLMILKEPNLCVVGDWKQGIYGFRHVSIDNITRFEEKTVGYRRFLNRDGEKRVDFSIPSPTTLPLNLNYRSSQQIIDMAYECIYLPGSQDEKVDRKAIEESVVNITAARDDIGDNTSIRFVQTEDRDQEAEETVRAIKDYVLTDKYVVCDGDQKRPVGFGDIAVICRKTEHCRMVYEACMQNNIPAYLQGDVQIMCTREGKLALAWLRYVNNDHDPWGFVPIMADLDYTPVRIREAVDNPMKVPAPIIEQRKALYLRRRRITELLTNLFQYYGLDNDITQAIITTMSTVHRGTLLTISDVIRMIEDDIENKATYPVENFIDSRAVTIMTMHKAKGLEFPVVILPFLDQGTMPSTVTDSEPFFFNKTLGVRCAKEIGVFGEYSKICTDWRTKLARAAVKSDYSEERRLMFVAMSRAKQYETLIYGPKPSRFVTGLMGERTPDTIDDVSADLKTSDEDLSDVPAIPPYPPRRLKLGVHEILDFTDEEGTSAPEGSDEIGGKGMEYGTEIHKIAELMCRGKTVDADYPEIPEIRKVLDTVSSADIVYSEIECGLPLDGMDVTLRGVIDMLALFEDHIEIHDWKTDVTDRFESEYRMQLSVYAHAVGRFYGKEVRCFIDYVSRGDSVRIDPLPVADIEQRVHTYMNQV